MRFSWKEISHPPRPHRRLLGALQDIVLNGQHTVLPHGCWQRFDEGRNPSLYMVWFDVERLIAWPMRYARVQLNPCELEQEFYIQHLEQEKYSHGLAAQALCSLVQHVAFSLRKCVNKFLLNQECLPLFQNIFFKTIRSKDKFDTSER